MDTKEQKCLTFPSDVNVEVRNLKTGDYSMVGHEQLITIERKAWSDLLGCMTQGRARFERELLRMRHFLRKYILVEVDSWVALGEPASRTKVNVSSVMNSLMSWMVCYDVHVIPIPRDKASQMVLGLLTFWWKNHEAFIYPSWVDFYGTDLGKKMKKRIESKDDFEIAERLVTGL